MKKIALGIIITLSVGVVAVLLIFDNTVHSSFDSYAELEKSGMFQAGWLPEYLPKSATDIQEQHDLDTNSVYATFNYKVGDNSSIKNNCSLALEAEELSVYKCKHRNSDVIIKLFNNGFAEYMSSMYGGI